MKNKILLALAVASLFACFFALSVGAAATNEFGTPEIINGIDLTGMNTDTVARVVIMDANGAYHTYPAQYVVSNNTKFYYNFKPINDALGSSYSKHSVVRIEVPDNITIATNCGDLCSAKELLEIKFFPTSELHTLEYGCFYNNKKLQKLNIPKKVTTIGTLIINNSHLEELIFDDGFCAVLPKDSFKGADGVKKVVLSNQMTTVDDRAFDSTLGEELEEFYMGASLLNLGTNNMAWVKQSVRYYIPAQFLSMVDTITMETFSWWSSNACLPTGVIFFTGTLSQAEALIAKSTYDRVFCSTAELVKWDPSVPDVDYTPEKGWKIVYDYGVCNAFYGGEHLLVGSDRATVTDFYSEIKIGNFCTRQGCGNGTVTKTIAPIFKYLGVSISTYADRNGKYSISVGYTVDKNAYEEYLDYGNLTYGLVASAVKVTGNEPLIVVDGQIKAKDELKTCVTMQSYFSHECIVLKVNGIGMEQNGYELVLSLFAFDGESICYLNESSQSKAADSVVINVGAVQ